MSIFNKVDVLWNTVKYLKPIQWRYRAKLWCQRFFPQCLQALDTTPDRQILNFVPSIPNEITYLGDNVFQFLNLQKSFGKQVNWEFVEYGRLWGYNLIYFEFLNQ